GLVGDRACAQRGADHRESAEEEGRQVELALGTAHEADLHEASADGERGEVLGEVLGADVIEDDVHAAPVGQLPGPGREVLAPVVDRGAGAEREAASALLLASGGHDQDDAGLARERDRRGAALDDRPGALEAENRRGSGGWRVETLALEEIGAVHGGGGDSDADVFGAERRRGRLAGYEDVLVARFADQDGAHVAAHHDRGWRVNGTLAPLDR